jgi:simple sugar transport system permease protein
MAGLGPATHDFTLRPSRKPRPTGPPPRLKVEPRGYESKFWRYASPVLALVLTGATSSLIFLAMGRPPGLTVYTFLIAPLIQQDGIAALVVKAAPLIMMGVGLSLAYRANVWNIGTDGQFTLGAICGGGVALAFPDAPAWAIFPAILIAGTIGGMLSGLVAWLRINFNANEILTSLMLAYITQYLLVYLVTGPWRDPQGFGFPQTALFSDDALGPRLIEDSNVHLGVLLAPLIAIALWFMLEKSLLGFQFRVLGQATRAARFAGFSENRLVWVAMLISGGLAGLAGVFEATGTLGQLTTNLSPGYGFTAIIVAFLGRLNPLGAIPAGLLLALTYLGGDAAQINLGLPNAVTGIFQGILLFYLLGCDFLLLHRIKWQTTATRPAR